MKHIATKQELAKKDALDLSLLEQEINSHFHSTWMRTKDRFETQLEFPLCQTNLGRINKPSQDLREMFSYPSISRGLLLQRDLFFTPDYHGGIVYIWPTKLCPLGCSHCLFGAPKYTDITKVMAKTKLDENQLQKAIAFTNTMKADIVVLSGGGEPFQEKESSYQILRNVEAPTIHIITNGFWANDQLGAAKIFDELENLFNERIKSAKAISKLVMKLSLDEAHQQHLPLENLLRIVKEYLSRNFSFQFELRMKSIFRDDKAVEMFLKEMRSQYPTSHVESIDDFKIKIIFEGGKSILVTFKNKVYSARGEVKIMDGLVSNYNSSYVEYIKSKLPQPHINPTNQALGGDNIEFPNGVNYTIEHDGSVKLLEATPLDNVPNISDNDFDDVQKIIFSDPISYLSRLDGPEEVYKIGAEVDPEHLEFTMRQNALYYNLERILFTPKIRLYATIRAIQILASKHPEIFKNLESIRHEFWFNAKVQELQALVK